MLAETLIKEIKMNPDLMALLPKDLSEKINACTKSKKKSKQINERQFKEECRQRSISNIIAKYGPLDPPVWKSCTVSQRTYETLERLRVIKSPDEALDKFGRVRNKRTLNSVMREMVDTIRAEGGVLEVRYDTSPRSPRRSIRFDDRIRQELVKFCPTAELNAIILTCAENILNRQNKA